MSDCIPFEVITLILSKLDGPTLLRCRSVEKPWRSLIDSCYFIKTHYQESALTKSNSSVFILEDDCLPVSFNLDSLCLGEPVSPINHRFLPTEGFRFRGCSLMGSCHGLLCFNNEEEEIFIFNPSIRKGKRIRPFVPFKFDFYDRTAPDGAIVRGDGYGFGYDAVSDDYKIVRIAHSHLEDYITYNESEIIIYRTRKGSTRAIKMPYVLGNKFSNTSRKMGAFVGGTLHWIARWFDDLYSCSLIIGFDLGVEQFREVPQPDYGVPVSVMNIGVLDGCLCVLADVQHVGIDVWIMKEYGVKESWRKVFSISSNDLSYESVMPLGYSRRGGEVLLNVDEKRLVWYDIKQKSVVDVVINGRKREYFETVLCMNTLIPPDTNAGIFVGQRPLKEQKKNVKKKRGDDFLSTGFNLKL